MIKKPRELFFSKDEYNDRLLKIRALMQNEGYELLITTNPLNICYLVGHFTQAVNDLMFLAVPIEGVPLLQLPQFEQARFDASGIGADVVSSWNLGEKPIDAVINEIKIREMNKGKVAIDIGGSYTPYSLTHGLIEGLKGQKSINLIESLRLVKSSEELVHIRNAAGITDIGAQAALDATQEGAVDYDIAASALGSMVQAGSESIVTDPYICVGWRTGAPHSNRGGEIAKKGDSVFVEIGATRARYTAPIMRSAVIGNPSSNLKILADKSNEVLDTLLNELKAEAIASDIALVCRNVIEPVLGEIIFHHTYAYSVGLSFAPGWNDCPQFLINEQNHSRLKAGMVFHLPMMLRVKSKYGAGFSETVIITEKEPEVLSNLPRKLISC